MYKLSWIRALCQKLSIIKSMPKMPKVASLHQPQETTASSQQAAPSNPSSTGLPNSESTVSTSNAATAKISSNILLMTCRVLVVAPDGSTVNARALLDSGSTVSFISERLAQVLRLPRSQQQATIHGVAGLLMLMGALCNLLAPLSYLQPIPHTRKFQSRL